MSKHIDEAKKQRGLNQIAIQGKKLTRERSMCFWYFYGNDLFDIREVRKALGIQAEQPIDNWKVDRQHTLDVTAQQIKEALEAQGRKMSDLVRNFGAEE